MTDQVSDTNNIELDSIEEPINDEGTTDNDDSDTFPRAYVEKLRAESAQYRVKSQSADALANRLHVELVKATGRLADPSDLPFNEAHIDDPATLEAAIDELIKNKPHLASRKPRGDIGQGATTKTVSTVDLAALLRSRA
ncbi:hypothetical protein HGA13_20510 [Nocardia speluncae]|uniref:Uncharacterized protein n=1 Tax=Nocardia speluncae TaxID=419477 RepID=A0A846XLJ7_9NOCA|nr:hypothetical protein [Nocardia speluncae]NKY35433.1 hypothetical protein [Nocardia speluncae]